MVQETQTIQKQKPEVRFDEEVVLNQDDVLGTLDDLSDTVRVRDFTAPTSGINHGHSMDKHDVRQSYGVSDEFVSKFFSDFGISPNDHAALWLLSYRKDEAINHDVDVFTDTSDTDSSRWSQIDSDKSNAPIPPETQQFLQS